ncbi:MAG: DsrE family protein [Phycisphaerales bacterium]|nr:DsrE family protein [Phycisphaerales bacterium]
MPEDTRKLVVILSRGLDDERSSVAFSIANAGLASGFEVLLFLVSSGTDWARRGAVDLPHLNAADPSIRQFYDAFRQNGGQIMVCPPCAKVRGYDESTLVEGVTVAGAPAMLEWVAQGARTISL